MLLKLLNLGKEQRLVAASCVFPRNAMLSSPPSFLICVLLQVHSNAVNHRAHALFGQSSNTAIKVFTCLYFHKFPTPHETLHQK